MSTVSDMLTQTITVYQWVPETVSEGYALQFACDSLRSAVKADGAESVMIEDSVIVERHDNRYVVQIDYYETR